MRGEDSLAISKQNYVLDNSFLISALALGVYDCILTFGREVDLVWRRKITVVTCIYCLARYPPAIGAALYVISSGPVTPKQCTILSKISSALGAFAAVGINSLMVARTWAICGRSTYVLVTLVILLVIRIVPIIAIVTITRCYVHSITHIRNLENYLTSIFSLIFDTANIAFTLYYTIGTLRLEQESSDTEKPTLWKLLMRRSNLTSLLIRQGLLRYVIIWLLTIIIVATNQIFLRVGRGGIYNLILFMSVDVQSSVACRLLLDLRGLGEVREQDAHSVRSIMGFRATARQAGDTIADIFGGPFATGRSLIGSNHEVDDPMVELVPAKWLATPVNTAVVA